MLHGRSFSHGILWVQLLEECSSPLLLVQTVVLVDDVYLTLGAGGAPYGVAAASCLSP